MSERILVGGVVVATKISWARSWRARARGLHDIGRLAANEALVLTPGRQVHTFGLDFDIDVVFCDRRGRVVHSVRRMKPRRVTRPVLRASYVIEMRGGTIPHSLRAGTCVTIVEGKGNGVSPEEPRRPPC